MLFWVLEKAPSDKELCGKWELSQSYDYHAHGYSSIKRHEILYYHDGFLIKKVSYLIVFSNFFHYCLRKMKHCLLLP